MVVWFGSLKTRQNTSSTLWMLVAWWLTHFCFCSRFEFVGGRMVWFTQDQAEHFLYTVDAGSFQLVRISDHSDGFVRNNLKFVVSHTCNKLFLFS